MTPAPRPSLPLLSVALPAELRGLRMLVAVSGGCDSVALLSALVAQGERRLVVCHFNHRLRGRESGADARFVRALAGRLGLEYEQGAMAPSEQKKGPSLEAVAREARYRFLASVARRRRCRTVLLAHHADDQVETVMMNFFRGSGMAGLGGMAPVSERMVGRVSLRLVRPLLSVWRREIEAYATAHKLQWREDASNASCDFTRNRLRNQWLPLLEEQRDIRKAIWRLAEVLREEERWLQTLLPPAETGGTLAVKTLRSVPVALQRRVILRWLREGGVANVGYREVEAVRDLLEVRHHGAARVNLPEGRFARRRAGVLFLEG